MEKRDLNVMLNVMLAAEAKKFTDEHFHNPTKSDYLTIENAMMVAATLTPVELTNRIRNLEEDHAKN